MHIASILGRLRQKTSQEWKIYQRDCDQSNSRSRKQWAEYAFTPMDYLNLLVCIPAIFWIAIGIRAHSNWIQSVFMAESKKIKQQSQMISEFGYGSLNTRDKLVAKKGLVFAYWEGSRQDQKPTAQLESLQSPAIFQLVNFSLVAGTSICLLMILSKGLFASIGLI